MFNRQLIAARVAVAMSGVILATSSAFAAMALVTNGSDDANDPGSLRAALADGADRIVIKGSVGTIETGSTLEYTGTKPLTIIGGNATISPSGDFTVLAVTEGADLTVKNLNIVGVGGFSVENQSRDEGKGKGIFVDVYGADVQRTDTVKVRLINVSISDVAYHGVHVSDCSIGDDCGSGGEGDGLGTPASIHLVLKNVSIDGVGYGVFDADGVRVDEREGGSITAKILNAEFVGVGADGVELDENGDGDVKVSMRNTAFNFNGGYCDPDVINPANPPYADDACVEDDDGELVLDLDDGIDIDEGGNGSVWVNARNVELLENLDEGFDFDEAGDGDIELDLVRVVGNMNSDEAIKASEEDDGDIEAELRAVKVTDTLNNDGIELEEAGEGDMFADLRAVVAQGSGDGSGVEIVQLGGGDLEVSVKGSKITGNSKDDLKVESFEDDDGDETGTGTLKVRGSKIDEIVTNVDEI